MDIDVRSISNRSGVYIIKCISNKKIYIGSCDNLQKKFKNYYRPKMKNKTLRIEEMNQDIEKYGLNNFQWDVLCICDCRIRTIVENYYITKYEAISLGYNKNHASVKLKNYTFVYNSQNSIIDMVENDITPMMNMLILDIFNFKNGILNYVMSVEKLICILEDRLGQFDDEMCSYLFDIFRRLDLSIFVKDRVTDKFYEISGNQILESRIWGSFKWDNEIEIDRDIKFRLKTTLIDEDTIYVECPECILDDYIKIYKMDEFRKNNVIIDVTYKQQYNMSLNKHYYIYM